MKKIDKAEIKQLAIDIVEGKIFTDRHIAQKDLIPHIFIPLAFGCFDKLSEEEMNNIGMIFEHLGTKTQSPMSLNGYPIFFSLQFLNQADTEEVFRLVEEYIKIKAAFKSNGL